MDAASDSLISSALGGLDCVVLEPLIALGRVFELVIRVRDVGRNSFQSEFRRRRGGALQRRYHTRDLEQSSKLVAVLLHETLDAGQQVNTAQRGALVVGQSAYVQNAVTPPLCQVDEDAATMIDI
jgi:hypothetical protein